MLGSGSIIGKSKIRLRGGFCFLDNPTKIGIGSCLRMEVVSSGSVCRQEIKQKYYIIVICGIWN